MSQFDRELWEGIRTNEGLPPVVKKALLNLMVIGSGFRKEAATYEQNTTNYSAAPGVFSNQNVGNDRGRIQPVEFNDPAFQRASKNMERGGTNAGANAYQGRTNLAQLIKTRDSVQKGTQEYADAQNAINQAYGSKVRHKPGASTGKGDQAVASIKGFGDATEKQTALTKVNPSKISNDYQASVKDVSRKQPSIVDSYMAGLEKATAVKPEVKKSSAFDVYDSYMKKVAAETDAFKELDETPVKKTDTEAIIDTWSKDIPALAVTPGKSKNPAMNLHNAKKEQKKQTGGK